MEENDREFRSVFGVHNFEWAHGYLEEFRAAIVKRGNSDASCDSATRLVRWQTP